MLALVLSLTACAQAEPAPAALADGGTILLSVNPEIAVDYDNDGFVTGITARNDDAFKVLANYAGFNGKQAHTVVSELVSEIGKAGYFVEEVEGEPRQIILEIEPGSAIPGAHFVDYVVKEVQKTIDENSWQTPLNLDGVSDYGSTDYAAANPGTDTNYDATDYSTGSNGVTDYNQPVAENAANIPNGVTDYSNSGYGTTDYAPSDYGTTDYDTTDYDNSNTDYNTSDYGGSNADYDDGNSDYSNTDYDDGNSDYHAPASSGNSDYGNSGYGDSAYDAPAPAPAPAPSYGGGDSGYSDYDGGGDSGYSDYSGYGES